MTPDFAFALDPAEALAFGVAFGEIESGGRASFDWDEMEWVER